MNGCLQVEDEVEGKMIATVAKSQMIVSQSHEKTLCQMHCAAVKEKGHGWVISSKEKPHVKD